MDLTFVISIFTGIITFVIIQFFVKLINKVIIPWYQSITYQGSEIDGEWNGFDANINGGEYMQAEKASSVINICQKGHRIDGDFLVIRQADGTECRKSFKINGMFYDDNLIVILRTRDRRRMGGGACVMRLTEDGQKLKGVHSFISSRDSSVVSRNVAWVRNGIKNKN